MRIALIQNTIRCYLCQSVVISSPRSLALNIPAFPATARTELASSRLPLSRSSCSLWRTARPFPDNPPGTVRRGFLFVRAPPRVIASETVSRFFKSSAVCQPGLNSRLPLTADVFSALPETSSIFPKASRHFVFVAHNADHCPASSPARSCCT